MVTSIFIKNLTMAFIQNLLTKSCFLKNMKLSINFRDIIIFLNFPLQIKKGNFNMINFPANLIINKNLSHFRFFITRYFKLSEIVLKLLTVRNQKIYILYYQNYK